MNLYCLEQLYICVKELKLRVDNRGWKHYEIEFTNTDPRMMKIFTEFMRKILEVEESRLRVQVFVYPDHVEDKLIEFWSNLLIVSSKQFTKSIKVKQRSGKYNPSKWGIAKV